MPAVIQVLGMPPDADKATLVRLTAIVQGVVTRMSALGLGISAEELFVFYPSDLVTEGLGEELVAHISGILMRPEVTREILEYLQHIICTELCTFAQRYLEQCQTVMAIILSVTPTEPVVYKKAPGGAFRHQKFD